MSLNPDVDADVPALLGASAALSIAGIPFAGPIGAAKVGYKDGKFILNPTVSQLEESALELVVAGTRDAVLMVESEAKVLPEDVMLGAVMFGHEQMQTAIRAINELVAETGKPVWVWEAPAENMALAEVVAGHARTRFSDAYRISDKLERQTAVKAVKDAVLQSLVPAGEEPRFAPAEVLGALGEA